MKSRYAIFNRRSLFWKIYLSMILVLCLPLLVFSIHRYFFYNERSEDLDSVVRNLEWSARLLANQADRLPDAGLAAWIRSIEEDSGLELYIEKQGVPVHSPDAPWVRAHLAGKSQLSPKGPLTASARSSSGNTMVVAHLSPAMPPPGNPVVRNVGFLIVAAISLLIAFLIVKNFMKPLEELRKITGKLAEGNFSARAGDDVLAHGEEIADLGVSFNWMAERVENVINAQKRLLVDISHELRSPLQRMDVALTLALDAEFEGQIQGKKIVTRIEPLTVAGDVALLRRALGNVIYNAIRYAPPETSVEIACRRSQSGESASTTVRDFGQGVSEDELEKIFLPYYRTDAARERPHGGTGLGLAITKRIIEDHDGRISAANAASGGLAVAIAIPLLP